MSILDPSNCTLGDMCIAAMEDCGRLGTGQTASGQDTIKAWARCQMMLQEWQQKRWLIYHLRTFSAVATGQTSYTFGPGGELNTNVVSAWGLTGLQPLVGLGGLGYVVGDMVTLTPQPASGTPTGGSQTVQVTAVSGGAVTAVALLNTTTWPGPLPNSWLQATTTGVGLGLHLGFPTWTLAPPIQTARGSQRPPKVESAFLRQIQIASPNQVDYFMDILQSHEDYDKIALKSLKSFPGAVFLDSDSPLGNLFFYPVPQASIYSINVTVREQLQTSFLTLATPLNLPWEYYSAILLNLALRLRVTFQIQPPVGDTLPGMANNSLNVLRGPNTQIARLRMPVEVTRPGVYNIFSDRNY